MRGVIIQAYRPTFDQIYQSIKVTIGYGGGTSRKPQKWRVYTKRNFKWDTYFTWIESLPTWASYTPNPRQPPSHAPPGIRDIVPMLICFIFKNKMLSKDWFLTYFPQLSEISDSNFSTDIKLDPYHTHFICVHDKYVDSSTAEQAKATHDLRRQFEKEMSVCKCALNILYWQWLPYVETATNIE